jgi:predicted anti-sigma-YlaC factor YlaD
MICDEVRRMLGAYVDNELRVTRQPDLEKHLAGCQSCRAAAEEINNFSSLIRMHIPVYKAPVELKAQIRASLRRESSLSWNGFPESVYR